MVLSNLRGLALRCMSLVIKVPTWQFFSAKLRKNQVSWLPCEVEALSIAAAITHFSPYIIQTHHRACVLPDSKPCVQAFENLCWGEFSSSPCFSTFLSVASRYQITLRNIAGSTILPSDFASRNAPDCEDPTCQVCSFVVECSDLHRTHAHLRQGTRSSEKLTYLKDIQRNLNVATIAKDGLLIVKRTDPLCQFRECINVPRKILHWLLTSLHIKLDHPSSHQLSYTGTSTHLIWMRI